MSEIFISIPVSLRSIDKKSYECGDCHLEFVSEQSLKKHVLQTHYEFDTAIDKDTKIRYRFSCPVTTCRRSLQMEGEYFPSRKLLVQHYLKVTKTRFFSASVINISNLQFVTILGPRNKKILMQSVPKNVPDRVTAEHPLEKLW